MRRLGSVRRGAYTSLKTTPLSAGHPAPRGSYVVRCAIESHSVASTNATQTTIREFHHEANRSSTQLQNAKDLPTETKKTLAIEEEKDEILDLADDEDPGLGIEADETEDVEDFAAVASKPVSSDAISSSLHTEDDAATSTTAELTVMVRQHREALAALARRTALLQSRVEEAEKRSSSTQNLWSLARTSLEKLNADRRATRLLMRQALLEIQFLSARTMVLGTHVAKMDRDLNAALFLGEGELLCGGEQERAAKGGKETDAERARRNELVEKRYQEKVAALMPLLSHGSAAAREGSELRGSSRVGDTQASSFSIEDQTRRMIRHGFSFETSLTAVKSAAGDGRRQNQSNNRGTNPKLSRDATNTVRASYEASWFRKQKENELAAPIGNDSLLSGHSIVTGAPMLDELERRKGVLEASLASSKETAKGYVEDHDQEGMAGDSGRIGVDGAAAAAAFPLLEISTPSVTSSNTPMTLSTEVHRFAFAASRELMQAIEKHKQSLRSGERTLMGAIRSSVSPSSKTPDRTRRGSDDALSRLRQLAGDLEGGFGAPPTAFERRNEDSETLQQKDSSLLPSVDPSREIAEKLSVLSDLYRQVQHEDARLLKSIRRKVLRGERVARKHTVTIAKLKDQSLALSKGAEGALPPTGFSSHEEFRRFLVRRRRIMETFRRTNLNAHRAQLMRLLRKREAMVIGLENFLRAQLLYGGGEGSAIKGNAKRSGADDNDTTATQFTEGESTEKGPFAVLPTVEPTTLTDGIVDGLRGVITTSELAGIAPLLEKIVKSEVQAAVAPVSQKEKSSSLSYSTSAAPKESAQEATHASQKSEKELENLTALLQTAESNEEVLRVLPPTLQNLIEAKQSSTKSLAELVKELSPADVRKLTVLRSFLTISEEFQTLFGSDKRLMEVIAPAFQNKGQPYFPTSSTSPNSTQKECERKEEEKSCASDDLPLNPKGKLAPAVLRRLLEVEAGAEVDAELRGTAASAPLPAVENDAKSPDDDNSKYKSVAVPAAAKASATTDSSETPKQKATTTAVSQQAEQQKTSAAAKHTPRAVAADNDLPPTRGEKESLNPTQTPGAAVGDISSSSSSPYGEEVSVTKAEPFKKKEDHSISGGRANSAEKITTAPPPSPSSSAPKKAAAEKRKEEDTKGTQGEDENDWSRKLEKAKRGEASTLEKMNGKHLILYDVPPRVTVGTLRIILSLRMPSSTTSGGANQPNGSLSSLSSSSSAKTTTPRRIGKYFYENVLVPVTITSTGLEPSVIAPPDWLLRSSSSSSLAQQQKEASSSAVRVGTPRRFLLSFKSSADAKEFYRRFNTVMTLDERGREARPGDDFVSSSASLSNVSVESVLEDGSNDEKTIPPFQIKLGLVTRK